MTGPDPAGTPGGRASAAARPAGTTVCYASTLFGAMSLAAAIDEGRFGSGGRRVLIVSTNSAVPEVTTPLDRTPGFAALRSRFDEIHSWNELIAPLHPADWRARVIEVPMLERLVSGHLALGRVDELVLESIAVPPARTIAGLVRDCPITVYSDGLMSYGPTRDPLPAEIFRRITRLLHLDLVPGLTPLLLSEYGVPAEVLPEAAFRKVVREVAATSAAPPEGEAMILGQYLSSLGIVTPEEEAQLHESMLGALAARGHATIVFKPHPAAGRGHRLLRAAAGRLGVRLEVVGESVPAEVCFDASRLRLVAGCFSTGLVTARRYFGLPVASYGTGLVLERLTPYENSNRVPVTIVDALLPRLSADGELREPPAADLAALVRGVGYCMQADAYPELRPEGVVSFDPRYFKRKRLETLGLAPRPTALTRLRRKLRAAL